MGNTAPDPDLWLGAGQKYRRDCALHPPFWFLPFVRQGKRPAPAYPCSGCRWYMSGRFAGILRGEPGVQHFRWRDAHLSRHGRSYIYGPWPPSALADYPALGFPSGDDYAAPSAALSAVVDCHGRAYEP